MTRTGEPTAAEVYELARSRRLLGFWLITRTPVNRQYPCRCTHRRGCPKNCPCAGRTDLTGMPGHCCAVRAAAAAAAQDIEIEMEAA